jgi:membrane peptidoglycan carboxypeptidase
MKDGPDQQQNKPSHDSISSELRDRLEAFKKRLKPHFLAARDYVYQQWQGPQAQRVRQGVAQDLAALRVSARRLHIRWRSRWWPKLKSRSSTLAAAAGTQVGRAYAVSRARAGLLLTTYGAGLRRDLATVRRSGGSHYLRIALVGVSSVIAALALVTVLTYLSYLHEFVPPEETGVNQPAGGAIILDRNGNLLFQYLDDDSGLRQPVALDQISPYLIAATIVTEDSNFFTNPGINYRGMARAVAENINPFGGGGSGGSSITQQLVKNVYFSPGERSERSLGRKLKETVYALELTDRYEKTQILEWYLNEISYGGLYYGVEAASRGYFGKPARDLTLAEAALLAGIPQTPAAYDPVSFPDEALARRNVVLDLLARSGDISAGDFVIEVPDEQSIEAAKQEPLVLVPPAPRHLNAPHFVLTYLEPEIEARFGREALLKDGLVITTTLDLRLQSEAERILERTIAANEASSNSRNGAVVVLRPQTGEILAMVGSRDYYRDDIQGKNNNLLALNSPGSAFKPFVYLTLFLQGNSGPGSLIDDSPLTYQQPDGSTFRPRNPDNTYQGMVTIRHALANSLNVPAFRVAESAGVREVVALGNEVGLTTLDGSYGPAISLGGVDVKPLDLAYAYTVLANQGVMSGQQPVVPHRPSERQLDPISVLNVKVGDGELVYSSESSRGQQRIVPQEHAFLVNSILTDPNAHCRTFGCGALSIPGHTVAVKTGTSEPFDPSGPHAGMIGETWAFGYTPDVVVAVWAGNADNEPVTNISSTTIAFRAMRDVMLSYYSGRASSRFVQPEGVVRLRGCYQRENVCVDDYFLRSDAPTLQAERQPSLLDRVEQELRNLLQPSRQDNRAPTPTPTPTPTPRGNNRDSDNNRQSPPNPPGNDRNNNDNRGRGN